VWGVAGRGLYLSNPLEVMSDIVITPQLSSPPDLLVRRADVVSRWDDRTDLSQLTDMGDQRWDEYNVLGQIVNVLREERCQKKGEISRVVTSHIRIPACYESGITLFCLTDNTPTVNKLLGVEDLPRKTSSCSSNS